MTTPARLCLSPNATDTAVLITAEGRKWAVVARDSATVTIDAYRDRHFHVRPISRPVGLTLIGLGILAALVTGYLYLVGTLSYLPAVAYLVVAVLPVVLTHLPVAPAIAAREQVATLSRDPSVLTVCPVNLARDLTSAEHSALLVAAEYDVVEEVLDLLVEQLDTSVEADRAQRRGLAEKIVDGHVPV